MLAARFARTSMQRLGAAKNRAIGGIRKFGGDGHDHPHLTFDPKNFSKTTVGKFRFGL